MTRKISMNLMTEFLIREVLDKPPSQNLML